MPTVARSFTVAAPPPRVFDYLKDFGNAEEWDPGTQKCTRRGDGQIGEGASWHNVSKIFGVATGLTHTLEKLTESTLVVVGKNKSSTSTDTITVNPDDSGSRLTYRADLEMKGTAKILNPVMKLVFEKLASDTEKQLSMVLNQLGAKE